MMLARAMAVLLALCPFALTAPLQEEKPAPKPKKVRDQEPPKEEAKEPAQEGKKEKEEKKGQEEAPKEEEKLHTVEKGHLTPKLELEATFEPARTSEVRLRFDAYQGEMKILSVAAHAGPVRKGDVLLSIDPKPLKKQIDVAENELRVTRAALAKEQADSDLGARADVLALSEAERALKNAEEELRIYDEVDSRQILQRVDLNVKGYEDYVSDQQEELDQLEKMYESEELTNATAEIVVRRARRALERMKIMLAMVRENARIFKDVHFPEQRKTIVASLEKIRQGLEALKASQAQARVQREAELARARAAVEQKEEQLEKLREDLENFTVRSPFDGRVFYGPFQQGQWPMAEQMLKMLLPGEKAQPQQVLMTLCAPGATVSADLPEKHYTEVHPDQAASVTPAAFPDLKMEGQVRLKGKVPRPRGPGPSFEVSIELKGRNEEILPGMKAKATLIGEELRDVVLAPSKAVAASGDKRTVTVSKDGKKSAREVKVGRTDGEMTEIRSGLEPGEQIVLPKNP